MYIFGSVGFLYDFDHSLQYTRGLRYQCSAIFKDGASQTGQPSQQTA